ncbi:MAG: hypothetical protein N2043_05060, partial [Ignavibacterium sp.]|nr:hypothetical protein [Ignavibacterium sp.]
DNNGGNTQTGAGTMSAKVDGVNWSATKIPMSPYPAAYANREDRGNYTMLSIVGSQIDVNTSSASTIQFSLLNINSTGEYNLGATTSTSGNQGIAIIGYSDGKSFGTTGDGEFKGKITITKFDLTNKIVSGTFYFTGQALGGGATGKRVVTEGKFDVKWGIFN